VTEEVLAPAKKDLDVPSGRSADSRPLTSLQFASLGSGSAGNSLLVRSANTTLLLDCGFTLRETLVRLGTLSVDPTEIDGVLISHEHGDHTRGVGPFSRKFNVPVWMTPGTAGACRDTRFPTLRTFSAHEAFSIGDITLDPFPTPHDAAESCQFVFSFRESRFACLTDLGACTAHVMQKVSGVDAMLIECNYDSDMLENGPYPPGLQARIRSNWGHLGNEQAGELLAQLDHSGLRHVLLGHLSERNNTSELAMETVCRYVNSGRERLQVLEQDACSQWITL